MISRIASRRARRDNVLSDVKLFCRILVIVSLCDRIRVRCFSMKKYSGLELAGHAAAGESISEDTFGAGSAGGFTTRMGHCPWFRA